MAFLTCYHDATTMRYAQEACAARAKRRQTLIPRCAGRTPPALVVYEVVGGTRYLADGRHRLVAYREIGRSEAPADVPNAAAALRAALQVLGPASFCRGACEEFLRQEERQAGTSPRGKGKP